MELKIFIPRELFFSHEEIVEKQMDGYPGSFLPPDANNEKRKTKFEIANKTKVSAGKFVCHLR
jgi:hypothetical protein